MIANSDGTLSIELDAVPSSRTVGRLRIHIQDNWLCPPNTNACVSGHVVGRGITINGVKLADGPTETFFSFFPPDEIRP
jgi:hypothetical protein